MIRRSIWFVLVALVGLALPGTGNDPAAAEGVAAPRIEVGFVLDTTGSMSGLLAAAQEQIWAIATGLACADPAPDLRLGLIAFRDRGDAYVTRVTDLTRDLDALYTDLAALQADGGGDTEESVNQALHEAVTKLSWSDATETYRALFLVGDAPPHAYDDDVGYAESTDTARMRGIVVNTIQCGAIAATTPVWTEIAARGGGVFSRLDQGGRRGPVATPYDDEIALMARQLDETRMPYGSEEERATAEERRSRAAAIAEKSPLAARAERGRFNVTAAGRANVFGDNDLLADLRDGSTRLEDVAEDRLPEVLRDRTAEQRRAHLERQQKLREDLELTIRRFADRRDDYLSAHGADEGSLTRRLFAAMQPQAARRGFALRGCARNSTPGSPRARSQTAADGGR
jgi:hypothetical protein